MMKDIDLYLTAGQSNSAGHSKVRDAESIYARYPALRDGYEYVLYAGDSLSDSAGTDQHLIHRDIPWCKARLGLGIRDDSYMGPEAGMAVALSKRYNAESGRTAGIIKLALGATSLLEKRTGSNALGNWVPPSYAEMLGIPFEKDPVTGHLYRLFLSQIRKNVGQLLQMGFETVNVKGLYWMQGCNNRYDHQNDPAAYPTAFACFAKDIRRDVAAILQDLTGRDGGAPHMMLVVGTISRTFYLDKEETIARINLPFIEMQKKLAVRISDCRVIDNSEFAVCGIDKETGHIFALGSDKAHWNQNDALEIGINAADAMMGSPTEVS